MARGQFPRLSAVPYRVDLTCMTHDQLGKRGYPRLKDPRTTVVGLFGIPTLINNAETLYWVSI